jgi:hypothetical protein
MDATTHALLASWGNFYQVTGAAAAALTGLQFIVQTLLASNAFRPITTNSDPEAGTAAFGSPTVVHFTLALILSAVLCAPWPTDGGLRATLGVLGTGAIVYSAIVLRRTLRQRIYVPVMEDWVWHILLPAAAYAAVLLAALLLGRGAVAPLFGLAAATLLLLCIGIHNAWDTVTYLTFTAMRAPAAGEAAPSRLDDPRPKDSPDKSTHSRS